MIVAFAAMNFECHRPNYDVIEWTVVSNIKVRRCHPK